MSYSQMVDILRNEHKNEIVQRKIKDEKALLLTRENK